MSFEYPKTHQGLSQLLLTYNLPTVTVDQDDDDAVQAESDRQQAWADAMQMVSPVQKYVTVYEMLKAERDAERLDATGTKVLAGCAHLISAGSWWGKGEEASQLLIEIVIAESQSA